MKKILITGAAGFIGSYSAKFFKDLGFDVTGIDNLSRKGSYLNKNFLELENINIVIEDINNVNFLEEYFQNNNVDLVLHLAAQVAVTSSVLNPIHDFHNNVTATFQILECIRKFSPQTVIIYASTNKVYGDLNYLEINEQQTRYNFKANTLGISESFSMDFHTPYGCSKGAADQYVLDYARTYGVKSVVFRQSCIYGVRQMGVEDQGWVAWLSYAAAAGQMIHIYGNGKQVRDLLYVDDLVRAYYLAYEKINDVSGNVFNIGGGPSNSLSIIEYLSILSEKYSKKIDYKFSPKRLGDQDIFISDNTKAKDLLCWETKVGYSSGISKMIAWQEENFEILKSQIF